VVSVSAIDVSVSSLSTPSCCSEVALTSVSSFCTGAGGGVSGFGLSASVEGNDILKHDVNRFYT
jgi:hypothetical protein